MLNWIKKLLFKEYIEQCPIENMKNRIYREYKNKTLANAVINIAAIDLAEKLRRS